MSKEIKMTKSETKKFAAVKAKIRDILIDLELPVPMIGPALVGDPCDTTDFDEIRLNVRAAKDAPNTWYARHVVGHYICGLEQTELSDKVADLIAKLLWYKEKA